MKNKLSILLVILLVSSAAFSQQEAPKFEVVTGISSFDISADDIDELRDFDWNFVLESFKNNPPNKPISISFQYSKDAKLGETDIDGFSFKVSGKSSEAQEIVDKSERLIREFISKD